MKAKQSKHWNRWGKHTKKMTDKEKAAREQHRRQIDRAREKLPDELMDNALKGGAVVAGRHLIKRGVRGCDEERE